MNRIPTISEAAMRAAEDRIPELAAKAGLAAHKRALEQTGSVVMRSDDGMLVEQFANGRVRVIKQLPPRTPVQKGMVFQRIKK